MSDPEMEEWIHWDTKGREGLIPDPKKVNQSSNHISSLIGKKQFTKNGTPSIDSLLLAAKKLMGNSVLPTYFNMSKFASFIRQLYA